MTAQRAANARRAGGGPQRGGKEKGKANGKRKVEAKGKREGGEEEEGDGEVEGQWEEEGGSGTAMGRVMMDTNRKNRLDYYADIMRILCGIWRGQFRKGMGQRKGIK